MQSARPPHEPGLPKFSPAYAGSAWARALWKHQCFCLLIGAGFDDEDFRTEHVRNFFIDRLVAGLPRLKKGENLKDIEWFVCPVCDLGYLSQQDLGAHECAGVTA